MSQPSPSPQVPPELLTRDSLPALLDVLRTAGSSELLVDLSGVARLPTPTVQMLLSATRAGLRLRLWGASPTVTEGLRALGLDADLPTEGAAA